jgi:D-alanyl-D-alanine carboxypeptidase/D-alanyl-D-alanine carboxypeptidase (penicillin-binding protein 5/6)
MTALVAIENSDISTPVSVAREAVGIEGSSIYLYEGERLSMGDLLYAMLLESANDAAAAIAIEVGGSIEAFAEMMNEKAVELGLKNTHFTNPHGLDDEEHFTTARELSIIACAAMRNNVFKSIVSTYKTTIPLNETEGVRLLINHNKMLKGYDGAIGIKTGYTKKSGRCLVSAAEKNGVELICVTLNAPNDWQDHRTMLDLGFSLFESRILCEDGEFSYIQPIIGGNENCVVLKNRETLQVTVPKSYPEIKETVELFPFTFAPVKEGEIMGRLLYTCNGEKIAETPIYATYSVDAAKYKTSLWERIISLFNK